MPTLTVDRDPVGALGHLAELHHLPQLGEMRCSRVAGHHVVDIALVEATAEAWRAALAAPPFAPTPRPHYTHHRSETLWMGAQVRLHYVTAD